MSLRDLAEARQRDMRRMVERQSVLQDARLVRPMGQVTSWLASARRHHPRRSDVPLSGYTGPAGKAVELVPPIGCVLSTNATFGTTPGGRCEGAVRASIRSDDSDRSASMNISRLSM